MEEQIRNYANLVVKVGQSVKPGQIVVLRTPVECREFAQYLVEYAYEAGAKKVYLEWSDDIISRLNYQYQEQSEFEVVEDFVIEKYRYFVENDASFISVSATDPENLKGIDPQKIMAAAKARNKYLKFYSEATMADKNKWTVISAPTKKWADKIFPDSDDSVKELWEAILKAVRCDVEDPIMAWENHISELDKYASYLNENRIEKLHFTSELGTDLTVKLPEDYLFASAGSIAANQDRFVANMPTEEVFTLPHKDGVDGIVYASKPLNYQGNLIADFYVEFKDGKVVNTVAKTGNDVLQQLIAVDEGASHLGEVALVSYETPISLSNILYYNTLFDENASCHLALGRAYPTCLKGGADLTKAELKKAGANDSAIHVDFMFGTREMEITATHLDGTTSKIFENGNFVI